MYHPNLRGSKLKGLNGLLLFPFGICLFWFLPCTIGLPNSSNYGKSSKPRFILELKGSIGSYLAPKGILIFCGFYYKLLGLNPPNIGLFGPIKLEGELI